MANITCTCLGEHDDMSQDCPRNADLAQVRMDDLAFDRQERIKAFRPIESVADAKEFTDLVYSKTRVLTYTKTYRVVTSLTDDEIIAYAGSSKIRDIDTLIDALDLMAELHERYGPDADNKVNVEVHSSKVDERDPGLF